MKIIHCITNKSSYICSWYERTKSQTLGITCISNYNFWYSKNDTKDEYISHLIGIILQWPKEIGSNDWSVKVKNKTESMIAFEDMSVMNRAASLATYELLGDAQLMNTELG